MPFTDRSKYVGATDFEDSCEPMLSKNEWGIDVMNRHMKGARTLSEAYVRSLVQGAAFTFAGMTWYLQTWSPDDNRSYTEYTLVYKGLSAGIPLPFVSGEQSEQTVTLSTATPVQATRTIRYVTRQSLYRYITNGRPLAPRYTGLDVDQQAQIISSIVQTADGKVYPGNVPSDLLSALSWIGYNDLALMQCQPVFGTPYFECQDSVTRLIPSP